MPRIGRGFPATFRPHGAISSPASYERDASDTGVTNTDSLTVVPTRVLSDTAIHFGWIDRFADTALDSRWTDIGEVSPVESGGVLTWTLDGDLGEDGELTTPAHSPEFKLKIVDEFAKGFWQFGTSGEGRTALIYMQREDGGPSTLSFETHDDYFDIATPGDVVPSAPMWVRVRRDGGDYVGEYSTNNATWTELGRTDSIPWSGVFDIFVQGQLGVDTISVDDVQIGTSHDLGPEITGGFDTVLATRVIPRGLSDIGVTQSVPPAFPATARDDFDRANGDPGSIYTLAYAGSTKPQIDTNVLKSGEAGATNSGMIYNGDNNQTMADGIISCRIVAMPATGGAEEIFITARTMNVARTAVPPVGSGWSGYQMVLHNNGNLILRKFNGTSASTVIGTKGGVVAGDSMGMILIGNRFQLWHKTAAGSWTQFGSTTVDNDYPTGYWGIEFDDSLGRIDDLVYWSVFDTIAKVPTRSVSDTGVTNTDSIEIDVEEGGSVLRDTEDTVVTHTDTIVAYAGRAISDTATTGVDTISVTKTVSLYDDALFEFPAFGVLDDFNRGDSATVGGSWTEGGTGAEIVSNQIASPSAAGDAFYNAGSFADLHAFVTEVTTGSGTSAWLQVRAKNAARNADPGSGSAWSGYQLRLGQATVHGVDKWTGSVLTALSTNPGVYTSGDSWGIAAIGNTIRVYRKASGSSLWKQVGPMLTDASSPMLDAGRFRLEFASGSSIPLDNFGGGEIVTDSIVIAKALNRAVSDTGQTASDSIAVQRSYQRATSDTGTTHSDSIAVTRSYNRALSDTGETQTDSIAISRNRVRTISDTGLTQTDSIAVQRSYARAISDTGQTHTDTLTSVRSRSVSDTGLTQTDSVSIEVDVGVIERTAEDTGVTQTDSLATVRSRFADDTGQTHSDSIAVQRSYARAISDTGQTHTDTVATVRSRSTSDTGVTNTDSVTAIRTQLRSLTDSGLVPPDPAFDAKSLSNFAVNPSWTHTPSGTPTGVVVLLQQINNAADSLTVTYGGVAMTALPNSPMRPATGGTAASHYAWVLNGNIPAGAQTVTVSGGSNNHQGVCVTLTGGATVSSSAGVSDGGLGRTSASVNVSATSGVPSKVFASGFTESAFGGGNITIPGTYTSLYETDYGSNGSEWFYLTNSDADGGTITASFTQDLNEASIAAWAVAASFDAVLAVATRPRVISDTGITQTDSIAVAPTRVLTDTGTTHSDSIAVQRFYAREASDTGATITDTIAAGRAYGRSTSDTAVTHSDSIAVQRSYSRSTSDTGQTPSDSIAVQRAYSRVTSDTATTHSDSISVNPSRATSDTGVTNTDSVAVTRLYARAPSDTGVTQTDALSTNVNRALSDTGQSHNDSVSTGGAALRYTEDTGVTHTDTLATTRVRAVSDTGQTHSDSIAVTRAYARATSDTGQTHTDTIASSRTRLLSDTGTTHSDSIAVQRLYARALSDTATTHTDTVQKIDAYTITDTGVAISDSIAVTRFYTRATSDTGQTHSDSITPTQGRATSDTGTTHSDSVAVTRVYARTLDDTGQTHTDSIVRLALFARAASDTAVTHDDSTMGVIYLRPVSDVTVGTWHDTPLFEKIDEVVVDDDDYIESALSPVSADVSEVLLDPGGEPAYDTFHSVSYRIGKDSAGGDDLTFTIRLVQGTTVIQSWNRACPDTPTTYTEDVTNADDITDYTDLRLRFEAVKV